MNVKTDLLFFFQYQNYKITYTIVLKYDICTLYVQIAITLNLLVIVKKPEISQKNLEWIKTKIIIKSFFFYYLTNVCSNNFMF